MKKICLLLFAVAVILEFPFYAHAELFNRGADSLGNRLIYDSDLDITWYDYTKSWDLWQNQMDWASGLTVDFGGRIYDDWRLPSTVDDPWVWGYDGSTSAGYNIVSGEMGHLLYTDLTNSGSYNTDGSPTGCGAGGPYCLTNTGLFTKLQPVRYWSGTERNAKPDSAWLFSFSDGHQGSTYKGSGLYAIAARPGDVAVVPEPASTLLFVIGGAVLMARRTSERRHR